MLAEDWSNYNRITAAYVAQKRAEGLGLGIVRAGLPWEHFGLADITRQQAQTTTEGGLALGTYCWAYMKDVSPEETAERTVDLVAPFGPRFYAIDCEDVDGYANWDAARNIDWLHRCVAAFQAAAPEPVVIYTGRWWWADHWMGNTAEFSGLPLWDATDTKVPDLNAWVRFGGWQKLAIAQYDLSGPDRDVIDDTFLEGGVQVNAPDVQSQLSYLGGLTHDILPQVIAELEAVKGKNAAERAHLERALKALRENVG